MKREEPKPVISSVFALANCSLQKGRRCRVRSEVVGERRTGEGESPVDRAVVGGR